MKISVVFLFVYLSVMQDVDGQKIDTIFLLNHRPLKRGYLLHMKDTLISHYIDEMEGVEIYGLNSHSDSVFALHDGRVIDVRTVDDRISCIISSGKTTISYIGLSRCAVKKNSIVKAKDFIGEIASSNEEKNALNLVIRKSKKKIDFAEYLKVLTQ